MKGKKYRSTALLIGLLLATQLITPVSTNSQERRDLLSGGLSSSKAHSFQVDKEKLLGEKDPNIKIDTFANGKLKISSVKPSDMLGKKRSVFDRTIKDQLWAIEQEPIANELNKGIFDEHGKIEITKELKNCTGWAHNFNLGDRGVKKSYIENCISKFSKLSPKLQGLLNDRLGVIAVEFKDGRRYDCTALMIASQLLLTARHCIKFKDKIPVADIFGMMVFVSLNGETVKLRGVIDNPMNTATKENKTYEKHDVILIETEPHKKAAELATLTLRHRQPKSGDRIIVLGYNLSLPKNSLSIREMFSWSDSPVCRVLNVQDGCIYHGCDTWGGTSGSPIISYSSEDGVITLMGVHSGAAMNGQLLHDDFSSEERCPSLDSEAFKHGNNGVVLDNLVMSKINGLKQADIINY